MRCGLLRAADDHSFRTAHRDKPLDALQLFRGGEQCSTEDITRAYASAARLLKPATAAAHSRAHGSARGLDAQSSGNAHGVTWRRVQHIYKALPSTCKLFARKLLPDTAECLGFFQGCKYAGIDARCLLCAANASSCPEASSDVCAAPVRATVQPHGSSSGMPHRRRNALQPFAEGGTAGRGVLSQWGHLWRNLAPGSTRASAVHHVQGTFRMAAGLLWLWPLLISACTLVTLMHVLALARAGRFSVQAQHT